MPAKLLLISSRPEDRVVWQAVANVNHLELKVVGALDAVIRTVESERQLMVIWDCDQRESVVPVGEALMRFVNPLRVFAVTDGPLNSYKDLFRVPAFAHHLVRRYDSPGPIMFSKLVLASSIPYPFGIERYLPAGTSVQRVTLKRSSHKAAAINAVQNVLERQKVTPRLANMASQAVDELIMNAIFDAPVDANGNAHKRNIPRDADFALQPNEEVILSLADAREYLAVQIADPYGSLDKNTVLRFLRQDFQNVPYVPRTTDKGAGLGLHGIIQSGLSLLFVVRPGVRTEVSLFFKKAETFKEFRESFRFVSIMSP
jgi:hypothetical protein